MENETFFDRIKQWVKDNNTTIDALMHDAFNGDLALDALVPGDSHRAETARPRRAEQLVSVEYELTSRHDVFLLRFCSN